MTDVSQQLFNIAITLALAAAICFAAGGALRAAADWLEERQRKRRRDHF
jgi:hypothetical protein